MTRPIFTTPTLLQGKQYTPAEKSDITKTWKAAGWKPKHKAPRMPLLHYERTAALL